jgi:hypothetical protein
MVTKKYPMSRENWILQMYDLGERGIKDFGTTAKKIIPATNKLVHKTAYGPRLKKLNAKLDVNGYDIPRADIRTIHFKNKKIVRVGGDNIEANLKDFKRYILPYINKSFTNEELRDLDIYIEYPSKRISIKFGGVATGWESDKHKKFSIIDLASKHDVPTAIHEMVHALKYEKHRPIHNLSKDEAETELETYVRLDSRSRKQIPCNDGYYHFIKGNKCKARKEDMNIIKSSCNIKNKKGLTKCIEKNLNKTNIGKLKIPKKYELK